MSQRDETASVSSAPARRGLPARLLDGGFRVLGAFLLVWPLALFGPLSILSLLLEILFVVMFVLQRCRVVALVSLLLSPLPFTVLLGIVNYARGEACLQFVGHPGLRAYSIDPAWRCGHTGGNCFYLGNEWLFETPYNFAVKSMITLFGPMAGAYTGPYPSKEEAIEASARGEAVPFGDFLADIVPLRSGAVRLDAGVGREIAEYLWMRDAFDFPSQVRAAVWKEGCLVLRIPGQCGHSDGECAALVLLDRNSGRPFAIYSEGDVRHHYRPVPWKRAG